VDRAYGPVDQERWRFMVDSRCRAAKSSPEQVLASVVGPDCSRRVGKKVEEALGFLTEGLTGRCDSKVRPAAVNQGGVALELGGEDGGALGVLYIGRGGEVRGRRGRAVTGGGFSLPSV
jgi:hypothetical protein